MAVVSDLPLWTFTGQGPEGYFGCSRQGEPKLHLTLALYLQGTQSSSEVEDQAWVLVLQEEYSDPGEDGVTSSMWAFQDSQGAVVGAWCPLLVP